MTPVSCDQKVRACGFGALEEAIVALVRRYGQSDRGHNQGAVFSNLRKRFCNSSGQNWKLGPTQDGFVFEKNWWGYEKPKTSVESELEDAIFQPERAEVR